MQDSKAHIDIIFRNGLKGLEVLPPPSAWNEISESTALTSGRRAYLSIAASVAVLVTMASALWLFTQTLMTSWTDPGALTLNQDVRPAGSFSEPLLVNLDLPEAGTDFIKENNDAASLTQSALPETQYENQVMAFAVGREELEVFEGDNDSEGSPQEIIPEVLPLSGYTRVIPDGYNHITDLSSMSEPKAQRWMIGGGITPSYQIRPSSDDPVIRSMLESERAYISYSGGVSVAFSFNDRLSLSTGLYYSAVGQMIDNIATYSGFSPFVATKGGSDITVNTTSGNIISTNGDLYIYDKAAKRVNTKYGKDIFDPVKEGLPYSGSNLMQQFGYLEMPFMLRYKVIDRSLDLNLLGGVSYSLMVGNSVYAISSVGEKIYTGYTEGLSPFNISSSMGVGMSYSLSNVVSLNVEPMLRYNISTIGYEVTNISKPWSFGVFSGLFFRF